MIEDYTTLLSELPGNFLILSPNAPTYPVLSISEEQLLNLRKERKEVEGESFFAIFHGSSASTFSQSLRTSLDEVVRTKIPVHIPSVYFPVDKVSTKLTSLHCSATVKPVFNSGGDIACIILITKVLAEQHSVEEASKDATAIENSKKIAQLEEELSIVRQQNEVRLQELISLFEQAPVAIAVVKGPQYVIHIANQKVCELWGRTQQEAVNKPLFELIPEAANQGFEELLNRVMRTGQPLVANEIPSQIKRHGKQETAYWNFVYYPFRDAQQVIQGVTVVSSEVTEQVKVRHKVEAGEKRYKSLLHGIPQMTWTSLPDGYVNFFNEKGYEYTGLTFDDLKGWKWKLIVHPDDVESMLLHYQKALENGKEYIFESRFLRHDGAYRWHLNRAVPLRNAEGEIELWVGASTDIHDQKVITEKLESTSRELAKINKELAFANEKIRSSNKALEANNQKLSYINSDMDNFIHTASHDLRTPISNIEGLVQVLQDQLSSEVYQKQKAEKIIKMMEESVIRFKNTIGNLSDVVKQTKDKKLAFVQVNLNSVILDVQKDLDPMIKKYDAVLNVDVSDCPYILFTEKDVRSVLFNLLSNAIKYHSPSRTPYIQVKCEKNGDYAVLTVEDNGIGMSKNNLDNLFTMHQRFHTHVEGTGIGLYTVKKIIEIAGGHIEVKSQERKGTSFKVYFKH